MVLLFSILLLDTVLFILETFAHGWQIVVKKRDIDHLISGLLMAIIMAFSKVYLDAVFEIGLEVLLVSAWADLVLRWWIHDLVLNWLRNKGNNYIGRGRKSAYTDKLLAALEKRLGFPPVLGRLVISILILLPLYYGFKIEIIPFTYGL